MGAGARMTRDFADLTRSLARAEGIPSRHLPAVVHRARRALSAVERIDGYTVLGGGLTVLAFRVVGGALRDHRAGLLEVRA